MTQELKYPVPKSPFPPPSAFPRGNHYYYFLLYISIVPLYEYKYMRR